MGTENPWILVIMGIGLLTFIFVWDYKEVKQNEVIVEYFNEKEVVNIENTSKGSQYDRIVEFDTGDREYINLDCGFIECVVYER